MTHKATYDDLLTLQGLIIRSLIERLSGTPSAAELEVARSLLKDNGVLADSEGDAALLRELLDLLKQRLLEALSMPAPSPSVLVEARQFLKANGIDKTGGPSINAADLFKTLAGLDLPFKA